MVQPRRVVPRLVAGIAALLLMSIASFLLSTGRLYELFPPRQADPTVSKLLEQISREVGDVRINIDVGKQVEQRVEQHVEVTSDWSLPATASLVSAVRSGEFRNYPRLLLLAEVRVQSGAGFAPVDYLPPTLHLEDRKGESAHISVKGRTRSRLAGSVRLEVLRTCPKKCELKVSVHSPDRTITAVLPPEFVETQTSSDVSASLGNHGGSPLGRPVVTSPAKPGRTGLKSQSLEIKLDDVTHLDSEAQVVDIPMDVRRWASTTWLLLWVLVPWAFLVQRLGGAVDPSGLPDRWRLSSYARTQRLLLTAGLISIAAVATDYLDDTFNKLQPVFMGHTKLIPISASSISILPAAFAIWALDASRKQQGRSRAGVLMLQAGALGAGFVCFTVAVLDPSPRPELALPVLLAGLGAALGGSLLLTFTLDPSRPATADRRWRSVARDGRWGASMSGCALLVTVALTTATNDVRRSALTAGVVAILSGTAMVATLVWTAAGGTGHPAVQRWRTSVPVRVGVLVAALLIVTPTKVSPGWPSSLARDGLIPLAHATTTLVRFGLLLTTVGMLWALAKRAKHGDLRPEVTRSLALITIIALLLRSDVLYRGIPLSFLVGSLLTVTLLVVPASRVADCPLVPPQDRGRAEEIKSLLDASARARTDRDRRAALRRKVANADLNSEDCQAIEEAVRIAYSGNPSPPSRKMRGDALAWAGTSDAWTRGILGVSAASVVMIFILGPSTLATMISDITRLSGPEPWDQLLKKLMTFRYPLYGFLFGYFLPLLVGTSGLAKAARLFIMLGASETAILLLPFPGSMEQFLAAATLRVLQLAMLCGVLGIGADLLALRSANAGPSDLLDLYQTSRLILWSSGVGVAVATAVATTLVGSATTLLVERILPDKHRPQAEAPKVPSGTNPTPELSRKEVPPQPP